MSEPKPKEQKTQLSEIVLPEVLSLLTDEQIALADLITDRMSDSLGISRSDVQLVPVDTGEELQVIALDASPNGQHIGKYVDIVKHRELDSNWYTVDFFGEALDPLAGMNEATYRAMVENAKKRGETVMPDSVELSHLNDIPWTATLLTGEALTEDGMIPIGSYSSDKVDVVGFNPNKGGISMRVRPAIVVARIRA